MKKFFILLPVKFPMPIPQHSYSFFKTTLLQNGPGKSLALARPLLRQESPLFPKPHHFSRPFAVTTTAVVIRFLSALVSCLSSQVECWKKGRQWFPLAPPPSGERFLGTSRWTVASAKSFFWFQLFRLSFL